MDPVPFRGLDEIEAQYRHVDVGGISTSYWECGAGEPVVLVHGSGAGVTAAANWLREFSSRPSTMLYFLAVWRTASESTGTTRKLWGNGSLGRALGV